MYNIDDMNYSNRYFLDQDVITSIWPRSRILKLGSVKTEAKVSNTSGAISTRCSIATIKTPRAHWSHCAISSRRSRWSRNFADVCLKEGTNIVRLNFKKSVTEL